MFWTSPTLTGQGGTGEHAQLIMLAWCAESFESLQKVGLWGGHCHKLAAISASVHLTPFAACVGVCHNYAALLVLSAYHNSSNVLQHVFTEPKLESAPMASALHLCEPGLSMLYEACLEQRSAASLSAEHAIGLAYHRYYTTEMLAIAVLTY